MTGMSGFFEMGEVRTAERFAVGLDAMGSTAPVVPGASSADRRVAVSRDGRFTALFEGRLVNSHSLRSQFVDRGHGFQTDDDAEIALAWFERDGVAAFDRLDGGFALAIYDQRDEELYLVRDRVGQMPLHYHADDTRVLFGTHLKTVVQATSASLPVCRDAVDAYLRFTYIPAPWTIYEGVFKLLPGTYLRVGVGGVAGPQPYWDPDYSEANQVRDHARCKELLRDALFASVEEALQTADHAGALLSGGIDSTIVAGIASRILPRPLDTFTVGFADRRYDETARAQLSADLHQTNHTVITLDSRDVLSELDELLLNLDEPYADSSYLAASMVSRAARQHVETVLSGDGGDELFAGYSKYLIGGYAKAFNKVPRWVSSPLVGVANRVLPAQAPLRRRIDRVVTAARLSPFERREWLMSLGFSPWELSTIMHEGRATGARDLVRGYYDKYPENSDELRRVLYLDFKIVLEGDMLPKMHYAGRQVGLRTAVPMLGRTVVDVAAQVPTDFKIREGVTKAILKETFSDLIPPELLSAPKSGFTVPLGTWLRGDLRPSLERALSEERVRDGGVLQYPEVQRLLGEHIQGRADHSGKLWALFVFQKWQEGARG